MIFYRPVLPGNNLEKLLNVPEFREYALILASTSPLYAIFVPKNEKIDYSIHNTKPLASNLNYAPLPAYRVDLITAAAPRYAAGIVRHANRHRKTEATDRTPAALPIPADYRPHRRAFARYQFARYLHGAPPGPTPERPRVIFRPRDWLGFLQVARPGPSDRPPAGTIIPFSLGRKGRPRLNRPPKPRKPRGRPRNTEEQNRATAARERELRKARDRRYAAAHAEQRRAADRKRRAARTGSTAARGACVWAGDSSAHGADSGTGLENRENRAGALHDEDVYFDFY